MCYDCDESTQMSVYFGDADVAAGYYAVTARVYASSDVTQSASDCYLVVEIGDSAAYLLLPAAGSGAWEDISGSFPSQVESGTYLVHMHTSFASTCSDEWRYGDLEFELEAQFVTPGRTITEADVGGQIVIDTGFILSGPPLNTDLVATNW